jgi:WD40 repeat protein
MKPTIHYLSQQRPRKVAPNLMKNATQIQTLYHHKHSVQVFSVQCIRNQVVSVDNSGIFVITDCHYNEKTTPTESTEEVIIEDFMQNLNITATTETVPNPIQKIKSIHTEDISRSTISSDHSLLITADISGLVVIYNTLTWHVEGKVQLKKDIWGINITWDDSQLLIGCNFELMLLNMNTLEIVDVDKQSHDHGTILSIGRHPTQDLFVTGGAEGHVCVFDCDREHGHHNKLVRIFQIEVTGWIGAVAFISDSLIVGGGSGKVICVWDITAAAAAATTTTNSNNESFNFTPIPVSSSIGSISVSCDYSLLAVAAYDGQVSLFTLPELKLYGKPLKLRGDTCIHFSSKLPYLVCGDVLGHVYGFEYY